MTIGSYKERSKQRTNEIRQLVIQGSTLDLCFLVDITSSMQPSIEMVKSRVVQIADRIKQDFPDLQLRYLNNYGYINEEELKHAATVHAFSHWTYSRTDGLLLVTDLQGVKEESGGKTTYWLSDPAIHCQHDILRFTKTNLGARGIDNFFKLHKCNDACRALGLEPPQPGAATKLSLDDWAAAAGS
ncbi:hypothetical protein WJX73_006252 [Symbiochloris irregularis]|uniref:Alpha-type protein kinase domain-containing protein n=1 Tax=Symbiochloris irregularis TaxID=706552 RepID=A0AAW1PNH1_9CHLO